MTYIIEYEMHITSEVKMITVDASSKYEAYDTAVYEAIPKEEGSHCYAAWVACVVYKNGRIHNFNTFEGKPY